VVYTKKWSAIFPDHSLSDYIVLDWMKEMVYIMDAGTQNALLGCVGDGADRDGNIQLKLQRAVRAIHNQAARGVAAEGGIFRKISLKHRSL
jgi:hypothetical protein